MRGGRQAGLAGTSAAALVPWAAAEASVAGVVDGRLVPQAEPF